MPTLGYSLANGEYRAKGNQRKGESQQVLSILTAGTPFSRPSYSTPSRPSPGPVLSARSQTYFHPLHPPGPLPYFLPPPGQPSSEPALPPPTSQALITTYPSRLRTGVTTLIQPEHITGGPRERELYEQDQIASGASTPRLESPGPRKAMTTNRRGRKVNYAEKESDSELSEESLSDIEEAPSDPEDTSYGERGRRDPLARREKPERVKVKRKVEPDHGWTWLGDRPPGERVRSARVRQTPHEYPYVTLDPADRPEEALLQADRPELLVPISIDLEIPSSTDQGYKIKDRFMWNVHGASGLD